MHSPTDYSSATAGHSRPHTHAHTHTHTRTHTHTHAHTHTHILVDTHTPRRVGCSFARGAIGNKQRTEQRTHDNIIAARAPSFVHSRLHCTPQQASSFSLSSFSSCDPLNSVYPTHLRPSVALAAATRAALSTHSPVANNSTFIWTNSSLLHLLGCLHHARDGENHCGI
ncbi:hypothetical protein K504DRAFT_251714 [Pleomassaria siparia CBS 279.74]|uniref:Uncharacterized protein n=1 Tax=Pleomassaria siparia CBS 279.74 TaxID=1314801 RepID=A0A6G1KB40_9PLEO|nr:hypothetical protein K504DRAFT_251714 [Pleomassaria siparia CBS 279.74]